MTELREFHPRNARHPSAPAAPFCFEQASVELFARRCLRSRAPQPTAQQPVREEAVA